MYNSICKKYADGYIRRKLNVNIQKSVRFDEYTYKVINNQYGKSFSEKIREYVRVMEIVKKHPEFDRIYNESFSIPDV